jgi:hypothetical protein
MLKSAKDVLASGDVGDIVDFAIEANRTVMSATKELGSVKAHLRGLAESQKLEAPGTTSVKFEGHLGVAQVVLGKPGFRARKGMKLGDLERVLPVDLYESLFVEEVLVTLSEDYAENFSQLDPAQRLVVENYVEFAPPTPRVNLPE